jgi:3-hydroxybutyryl-CoA dehydratase
VDEPRPQLAAEDLVVGSTLVERRVVFDAALFAAFSALSGDHHPIHDDVDYARAKGLAAPIAHGLLVVAMTALGATAVSDRFHASMVAMTGTEARFLAPVLLGDEARLVFTVGEVVPASRGRSRVRFDVAVHCRETHCAKVALHFLIESRLRA